MSGKWQKSVPDKDGQYWTATRDGLSAGLATVVRHGGQIILAGHTSGIDWAGWWWSERVTEPAPPRAEEWEQRHSFRPDRLSGRCTTCGLWRDECEGAKGLT